MSTHSSISQQADSREPTRRLNRRERLIFAGWLLAVLFLAVAGMRPTLQGIRLLYGGTQQQDLPLWAWFACPVVPMALLFVISWVLRLPERFFSRSQAKSPKNER
jgi:hypothetical protein